MRIIEKKTTRMPLARENDILLVDDRPYRVLSKIPVRDESGNTITAALQLIALDVTKFEIMRTDMDVLKNLYREARVCEGEDVEDYQFPNLEAGSQALTDVRFTVLKNYIDGIYPDFKILQQRGTEKEGLQRTASLLHKTVRQTRRILLRFLQEGQTKYSVVDRRADREQRGYDPKAGAVRGKKKDGKSSNVVNDEALYRYFEEAYRRLQYQLNDKDYQVRSKNPPSLSSVYRDMIDDHYSYKDDFGNPVALPDDQCPSKERFIRWVRQEKWGGGKAKDRLVSRSDWNNNRRLLTGDARYGVHHPGELVEIDETEVSFDLTTADPERPGQNIGGAIIHLAVDVATGIYAAVTVSIQVNNSYEGVLNVFDMLLMDNAEKCRMLGVDTDTVVFPGPIIPEKIRVDQGAEYTSKALMENLSGGQEYYQFDGIPTTIKLTRPGTGSNKASVERPWSEFDRALADACGHGHGYRSDTHGSKHRIEAHCNIIEFRKIVFEIVKAHNLSPQNHPVTPELIAEVPDMTPMHMWEYLETHYGYGITIDKYARNAYRYSLMLKKALKISRKQVSYKDILYWDVVEVKELVDKALMYKDKSEPIEVRIDPRTVSKVYYKDSDGVIYVLPLAKKRSNMKPFAAMRWAEFDKWYAESFLPHNKNLGNDKERALQDLHSTLRRTIEESAASAPVPVKGSTTTEIRKAGAIERKALTLFDNSIRDDIMGTAGLVIPELDGEDVIDVGAEVITENKAIDLSDKATYAMIMGLDPDEM